MKFETVLDNAFKSKFFPMIYIDNGNKNYDDVKCIKASLVFWNIEDSSHKTISIQPKEAYNKDVSTESFKVQRTSDRELLGEITKNEAHYETIYTVCYYINSANCYQGERIEIHDISFGEDIHFKDNTQEIE